VERSHLKARIDIKANRVNMPRTRMDCSRRLLGMFLLACTMLMLSISMPGQESSNSDPTFLRDGQTSEKGVAHRHRGLQDTAAVDVGLYLAVRYLDESVASQLETKDPSNKLVSHFCKSINYQVCNSICIEVKEKIMLELPLVAVITHVQMCCISWNQSRAHNASPCHLSFCL
jgi:hypothetical protein